MNNKRGFTLIELLAVIIVIAIIITITIPNVIETMNNSKKQALITFAKKAITEAEQLELEKTLTNEPQDKLRGVNGRGKYAGNIKLNDKNGKPYYTIIVHDDKYCLYNLKINELKLENVKKYEGIKNKKDTCLEFPED